MADTYPAISDFARAFAAEYSGFMKANDVKGFQIAEVLGRAPSYVSDRTSGKRALDADDVDALAGLVEGWTGRELMIELARRVRETQSERLAPITPIGGVRGSSEDLPAAARPREIEPTDEQP